MLLSKMSIIMMLPLLLSACTGRLLSTAEESNSLLVAAAPLCEEVPGYAIATDGRCTKENGTSGPTGSDGVHKNQVYVARIVNESEYFCGKFVNSLVLASIGANTDLDILTTVFSALGTAFTPISTVHAFTAAASISSGWKTAIASDVYAQASIANYAQAIQSTYYTDINDYMNKLGQFSSDDDIVPASELTKIRSIHKECSLPSAQAAIHVALQAQAPGAAAANAAQDINVLVKSVTAGTTFELTGTSPSLNPALDAKYKANKGDTQVIVARKLVNAVLGDTAFRNAGVTATLDPDTAGGFILHGSSSAITWNIVSGDMTISGGKTTAAPAAAAAAAAATTTKHGSQNLKLNFGAPTSGVTPGHGPQR